jgi:hypothetical protein
VERSRTLAGGLTGPSAVSIADAVELQRIIDVVVLRRDAKDVPVAHREPLRRMKGRKNEAEVGAVDGHLVVSPLGMKEDLLSGVVDDSKVGVTVRHIDLSLRCREPAEDRKPGRDHVNQR